MRPREKFGIISKTWEEVTEPVFERASEYFPKYIVTSARRYTSIVHSKFDGSRKAMATAGIYVALLESDIIISQAIFCEMFDISVATLRKWFDNLCSMMDKQKVKKIKRRITNIGYLTYIPRGTWRRRPYYELQSTRDSKKSEC